MKAKKSKFLAKSAKEFEDLIEERAKFRAGERGPLTYNECSKLMGISPSMVKAIEWQTLQKLKKELAKFGIKSLDDVFEPMREVIAEMA